jgi:hypothetical protein
MSGNTRIRKYDAKLDPVSFSATVHLPGLYPGSHQTPERPISGAKQAEKPGKELT